jgi:hypothetical protein
MAKKDALWESESGLTVMTALSALHQSAQEAFDHFFLSVSGRSGGRITVRTASDIAAKLTEALFSPISQQIDPIHLGEVYRSMAIARDYGMRLMKKSQNFDEDDLSALISQYPSHSFVIDAKEASNIFRNVRLFTDEESASVDALGDAARIPSDSPVITYLSEQLLERSENEQTKSEGVLEQPGIGRIATPPASDVPTNGKAGEALPGDSGIGMHNA